MSVGICNLTSVRGKEEILKTLNKLKTFGHVSCLALEVCCNSSLFSGVFFLDKDHPKLEGI